MTHVVRNMTMIIFHDGEPDFDSKLKWLERVCGKDSITIYREQLHRCVQVIMHPSKEKMFLDEFGIKAFTTTNVLSE